MFFLGGHLVARFPTVEARIHSEWRKFGPVGLCAQWTCSSSSSAIGTGTFGPGWFLAQPLDAITAYAFVLAAFGFAHTYLMEGNRALSWLSESAFPLNLLHQVAVVVMAVLVVDTVLPIPVKFALVCAGAIILTLDTCEFPMSRTAATQFLFGVRRRHDRVLSARTSRPDIRSPAPDAAS